jgi:hypothetical protein
VARRRGSEREVGRRPATAERGQAAANIAVPTAGVPVPTPPADRCYTLRVALNRKNLCWWIGAPIRVPCSPLTESRAQPQPRRKRGGRATRTHWLSDSLVPPRHAKAGTPRAPTTRRAHRAPLLHTYLDGVDELSRRLVA